MTRPLRHHESFSSLGHHIGMMSRSSASSRDSRVSAHSGVGGTFTGITLVGSPPYSAKRPTSASRPYRHEEPPWVSCSRSQQDMLAEDCRRQPTDTRLRPGLHGLIWTCRRFTGLRPDRIAFRWAAMLLLWVPSHFHWAYFVWAVVMLTIITSLLSPRKRG